MGEPQILKTFLAIAKALGREGVWRSGCIDPHFLDLVASWRSVLASRPGRFTPEENLPVPIGLEVWCTPEPVWTTWRRENS
jgi:hypothetical protein